jgi:hypothetical protein
MAPPTVALQEERGLLCRVRFPPRLAPSSIQDTVPLGTGHGRELPSAYRQVADGVAVKSTSLDVVSPSVADDVRLSATLVLTGDDEVVGAPLTRMLPRDVQ